MIKVVLHTVGTDHADADTLAPSGLRFDVAGDLPPVPGNLAGTTGLDKEIRDYVLGCPGAMALVERIAESAKGVLDGYADKRHKLVHVTISSQHGRRRAVAVAEETGRYLETGGIEYETDHHHISR